ncbi:MAG: hypothetical protein LJF04_08040 [Gemmatimonadetes bacterium]|nr:hypothetical protein [Gemmatimonadota bacterium]
MPTRSKASLGASRVLAALALLWLPVAAGGRYLDLSKMTIVKAGDFAKAKAKIG